MSHLFDPVAPLVGNVPPAAPYDGTYPGKLPDLSATKARLNGALPVFEVTNKPAAPTAANASTVDSTYGAEEAAVINNLRTRVGELEAALRSLGLIT